MIPTENNKREIQKLAVDDPAFFTRYALGITTNFDLQNQILRAVRDHPRVAIRAGNGFGKTHVAAEVILWAASTFTDSLVITTASTNRQVEKVLWGKIHEMYYKAPRSLGGVLLNKELRFPKNNSSAYGYATDDPGLFEGWHSPRILLVIDEAKSVPQSIFDAVERCMSTGAWVRLLVISTPGDAIGPFYECFTRQSHLYKTFHCPASSSPFVRKDWIEEKRVQWGENSPLFQSAVMANFPTSHGGVVPLDVIMLAIQEPGSFVRGHKRAGVDLAAGGGDESVWVEFDGNKQTRCLAWHEPDTMVSVGKIIQLIRESGVLPEDVKVDCDGLGKPIYDRLVEQGYNVTPIYNGGSPVDREQYVNASAEMWAGAAQLLRDREVIPIEDSVMVSQLTSRKQKPRSDGRVQLESKEDMKKRGLPSPDRADAFVMALYEPPFEPEEYAESTVHMMDLDET